MAPHTRSMSRKFAAEDLRKSKRKSTLAKKAARTPARKPAQKPTRKSTSKGPNLPDLPIELHIQILQSVLHVENLANRGINLRIAPIYTHPSVQTTPSPVDPKHKPLVRLGILQANKYFYNLGTEIFWKTNDFRVSAPVWLRTFRNDALACGKLHNVQGLRVVVDTLDERIVKIGERRLQR